MLHFHQLQFTEDLELWEARAVCDSMFGISEMVANVADDSINPRVARTVAALIAQLGDALSQALPPLPEDERGQDQNHV